MARETAPRARYDTQKMVEDMALRGLNLTALADVAGLSVKTVAAFIAGKTQTAKCGQRIALALGYSTRRYLIRQEAA